MPLILEIAYLRRSWIIEIASQAIFGAAPTSYRITLGDSTESARAAAYVDSLISPTHGFTVQKFTPQDLWKRPIIEPKHKNVHLVVLSHGAFSNLTADMLYLKERIEQVAGIDKRLDGGVVVRGYSGNVRKTEYGLEYLGKHMAQWLLAETLWLPDVSAFAPDAPRYSRISFIGHSLGGLVQNVAINEIDRLTKGVFFQKFRPVNLITLASPWLGVSAENPAYVNIALDTGVLGLTGQDLSLISKLSHRAPGIVRSPILRRLAKPTSHAHRVIRTFRHRTLYANAINDGIVPLRASAMFFLDWSSLDTIKSPSSSPLNVLKFFPTGKKSSGVTGPPQYSEPNESATTATGLLRFFSLSGGSQPKKESTQEPKPSKPPKPPKKRPSLRSQTITESLTEEFRPPPPKTSVFKMFPQLLNPPLPNAHFITHPDCRPNTIFHDAVYTPDQIPPISSADGKTEKMKLEEKIARDWHSDMAWRKVLVKLEPEAHNNIIVRRMFPNAYGWPVIEHLVKEHFLNDPEGLPEEFFQETGFIEMDPMQGNGLQNEEEDEEDVGEGEELTSQESGNSSKSSSTSPDEPALLSEEEEDEVSPLDPKMNVIKLSK